DHPEPRPSELGPGGAIEAGDHLTEHDDLSVRRKLEAGEQMAQVPLARSGRAGDDREPTLAQSCREVGEDLRAPPSRAEQLLDPSELGDRYSGRPSARRPCGSTDLRLGDGLVAADDDLIAF